MASHPGEEKRPFPVEAPVTWNPLRRDLVENENWYRDMIEHSQDLVCVHDLEGRFLSVNPIPARLLGYSVEEMMRTPMRDFTPPQYRAQFDDYIREIESKGKCSGLMSVLTKSGEERIWEYHNTLRTNGAEKPVVCGIAHDVTDRERAQRALRGSEQRYRLLFEKSLAGVAIASLAGQILDCNDAWARILGHAGPQEIRGRQTRDFYFNLADRGPLLAELRQKRAFSSRELLLRRKDGTPVWVLFNAGLFSAGNGEQLVQAAVIDINERKRMEQALRDSEARERARAQELQTILDTIPVPVLIARDPECRHMTVNRAGLEHLHLQPGDNASLTAPPEKRPRHRSFLGGVEVPPEELPMQRAAATGLPVRGLETKVILEDGTIRNELANAAPLLDDKGNVRGAVGAVIDITQRILAEKGLRESEERLRLAQEVAHIGMFERNLLTGESRWTPEMEAMYGLAPGGFPKTIDQFVELVHPGDRQLVAGLVSQSMELGDAKGEWRVIWPDGTVRWISGRWQVSKDGSGKPTRVIGMDFDITERMQAEEALRLSEERFRVALKHSPITVFNQDRDLRYTWLYNPQVSTPVSEILGKRVDDFPATADAERAMEIQRRVLETGVGIRHEVQFTDENRKHYLDVTIEPVLDPAGAVIGLTGASMDVTELRETTEAPREAKKKLTEEKLYLEHEIDTELGFGEILGHSKALQAVLQDVGKVAACNATVLLLGETGTGKELVARAVHRLSPRGNASFIKLNCAAIPSGLLESELFGNEKGAFTGAVSRKIGRLELADKGTLFLDEIGEIPLALQPKLLRVLQDQEFERLGGTQTLQVDFRLIAATNRDLADSMRENEFRRDLYYRLNVFPIRVPPLRDRREDIPLLVEHFVQKCARRMNKSITSIPTKTMDALRDWEWPGNVRELENFIERSVILTHGSVLVAPLSELQPIMPEDAIVDDTLEAAERVHILRALRDSRGQIGGPRGAAVRLGLKRTTLQSKLKHMGINPRT